MTTCLIDIEAPAALDLTENALDLISTLLAMGYDLSGAIDELENHVALRGKLAPDFRLRANRRYRGVVTPAV